LIFVTYGQRLLSKQTFADVYKQKYKGLAISLEMFSHSLAGNYTNFGVFEVYSDMSLSNSLRLALQMCLAIPETALPAYIKSLRSYYSFLDLATRNFMSNIMELDCSLLAQLIRCIEDGLCSFETGVATQCCSCIDNIVSFFFLNKDNPESEGQAVRKFLLEQPQPLKRVLQLMFQLVIAGELTSTWSMSRPLLGLILLYEEDFIRLQEVLTNQQVEEKKEQFRSFFRDLMNTIDASLSSKNKDLFTRNLYNFAHNIRALV